MFLMPWIHTIVSGPLQTNAYLIGADTSEEAILIDAPPGCFKQVEQILDRAQRRLRTLLLTHAHFDHILDLPSFAAQDLLIMAHAEAQEKVRKPQASGFMPEPEGGFLGAEVDKILEDGDKLTLAGLDIDVLAVPGHAPESLAYHIPSLSLCFVGDLIFRSSVGRVDLPGGDFSQLKESIKTKIYTLDGASTLYPGHGGTTSVAAEGRSNPYVKFS